MGYAGFAPGSSGVYPEDPGANPVADPGVDPEDINPPGISPGEICYANTSTNPGSKFVVVFTCVTSLLGSETTFLFQGVGAPNTSLASEGPFRLTYHTAPLTNLFRAVAATQRQRHRGERPECIVECVSCASSRTLSGSRPLDQVTPQQRLSSNPPHSEAISTQSG
eukprot:461006-Prorocentrum_minimum.AAC.1